MAATVFAGLVAPGAAAAVGIAGELGDPHAEAECLRELGVTLRALDRLEEARTHWQEALAIIEQLQITDAGQVRALLIEQPGPDAGLESSRGSRPG